MQQEEEDRIQAFTKQHQIDDEAAYLLEVARQIEEEAERHEQLRKREKEKAEHEEEERRQ